MQSSINWKRACIPGTVYTFGPAYLPDPLFDLSKDLVPRLLNTEAVCAHHQLSPISPTSIIYPHTLINAVVQPATTSQLAALHNPCTGIDGFHSIFKDITSPCSLLIGQYPHHMALLPSSFYGERCYGIRPFAVHFQTGHSKP